MLKIVIDTNIFISAFLTGGDCEKIIKMWMRGKVTLLVSLEIIEEITRVLKQLDAPQSYISRLIKVIKLKSKIVKPYRRLKISRDPQDDKFIECAVTGKADVIISGDSDLKDIKEYKGILILGVKEFLDGYYYKN